MADVDAGAAQRGPARRGLAVGVVAAAVALGLWLAGSGGDPDASSVQILDVQASPAGPGPEAESPSSAPFVLGQWEPLPDAPLSPRRGHAAVWDREELLIWGGVDEHGAALADGAAYNPITQVWRPLPASPLPPSPHPLLTWTGSSVLVLAGDPEAGGAAFAAYDPAVDQWRSLAPPPGTDSPRVATWAGRELVVGLVSPADLRRPEPVRDASAPPQTRWLAYHPAADTWRELPSSPGSFALPASAYWDHASIIAVFEAPGRGGTVVRRLDPAGTGWENLPPIPAPAGLPLVFGWTGYSLLAAPATSVPGAPVTLAEPMELPLGPGRQPETWQPRPPRGPISWVDASSTWTGRAWLLLGGQGGPEGEGAVLSASSGDWAALLVTGPTPRPAGPETLVRGGLVAWGGDEQASAEGAILRLRLPG